jgi:hypothetical protein
MLTADGGSGGSSTDWAGMSIEMMRTLIKNPNIEAHYQLLTGWQRSYELVSDHMTQVISYRDNLMAAWPPKKGSAAAAYRDRLDDLIANLNATYEASLANHDAFASATLSISLAQHDFDEIWQEHEANKAKLAEYQTDLAMSSAATFDTTPPVTAMQQESVRQKAIALMSGVSSDLAQAQAHIVRPSPYLGGTGSGDTTKPFDGSTYSAPLVPPITPTFTDGSSPGIGSTRPSEMFLPGPAHTGVTVLNPGQPGVGSKQPGLILGGTAPPVASPPSTAVLPSSSPPLGGDASGPDTNLTSPSGTNPFLPNPNASTLPPGKSAIRGVDGKRIDQPGTKTRGGLRTMPPGGLIGGTPPAGPSQPGSGRPSTRRINPIGGVIGEGETNGRAGSRGLGQYSSEFLTGGRLTQSPTPSTGRAGRRAVPGGQFNSARGRGAISQHSYGQSSGRKRGSNDSENSRWDPEDPWRTAEGVDPVLKPPPEQRIDPGPAIGLS